MRDIKDPPKNRAGMMKQPALASAPKLAYRALLPRLKCPKLVIESYKKTSLAFSSKFSLLAIKALVKKTFWVYHCLKPVKTINRMGYRTMCISALKKVSQNGGQSKQFEL